MASSSLPAVLTVARALMRGLPGLNPDPQPSDQDQHPVVCLVYSGNGRTQLSTSRGDTTPVVWQFETIVIAVYTAQSDLGEDLQVLEPYTYLVPRALFAKFAKDRWNDTVVNIGDSTSPGSTWPIRRALTGPVSIGGVNCIGYEFECDVTFQEDVLYDS